MHTFHLARASRWTTVKALFCSPTSATVPGLQHAECMTAMELGTPVVSLQRLQLNRLAVFAAWDNEQAIDDFLAGPGLGSSLANGWHVRLEFLRRWGHVTEFDGLPMSTGDTDPDLPVVALTLARLQHPQLFRFIKWGQPVEQLVRDDPATAFAVAAMRPPRTVSTFSVWRTEREMTDMVRGHSAMPQPDRHAAAMRARNRKDFHFEFTTLRFRALSEHGLWQGRTNIVPTSPRT